jgi:hypothetical protein
MPLPPPNKPTGHQCVNLKSGKTSYILLKAHGKDFPPVKDGSLGAIKQATVKDLNNPTIPFVANPVDQAVIATHHIRVVVELPGQMAQPLVSGGGDPITDGLLSITLQLDNGAGTVLNPTQDIVISDVPVDYVYD